MQTAKCTIRLNGDVLNTVVDKEITSAEFLVLREIHGADAIVDFSGPTGNDKRSHAVELDRLRRIYKAKRIESTFPGVSPTLPATFKDAGITLPRHKDNGKPILTGGQRGVPKPNSGKRKKKPENENVETEKLSA
ncbi:MAG: hypothetical protein JKY94_00950 [Rhodobacteraceae bacterium]|nr:hypothetical protein [Paracoccaceae bacterium]